MSERLPDVLMHECQARAVLQGVHTNCRAYGLCSRLQVDLAAERLERFFATSAFEIMRVLGQACGHRHLNQLCLDDLTTWTRELSDMAGVAYAGGVP